MLTGLDPYLLAVPQSSMRCASISAETPIKVRASSYVSNNWVFYLLCVYNTLAKAARDKASLAHMLPSLSEPTRMQFVLTRPWYRSPRKLG